MRIAHVKIALFVLVLLAPLVSLACFGTVERYGKGSHPEFPPLDEMLRGKKGRMDQFGEALLHRSVATVRAIQARSWVSYRVVGFVDTRQVVSGEGEWLFYRPEFENGHCLDEAKIATSLRRLAALLDVGRAAGIDMFISMSPNKSTVYPERLNQRMRGYWRCRTENVAAVRRLLKRWAPMVIDHAEPMLEEKARHPDRALFFMTDTHWSPYGAAIALRQLLAKVFPGAVPPRPRLSGETAWGGTDLRAMLLSSSKEQFALLDPAAEAELKTINHDPADYRTLIIRDSFYGTITSQLESVFANGRVMHAGSDDAIIGAEIAAADRLIINSVERQLISPNVYNLVKWNGTIAAAVLARNAARAKECAGFIQVDSTRDGSDDGAGGTVVAIPARSPAQLPCLRLTLAASGPGVVTIELPDPASRVFEPGRSLKYEVGPGAQTIAFVLPDYVTGSGVGLQADKTLSVTAIEIGEIEQPRLASALQP